MKKICLNFYDEKIVVNSPDKYVSLKEIIAQNYYLSKEDVEELIIYYIKGFQRINLDSEDKYYEAVRMINSSPLEIYLEVSEKSKLYMNELENSKIYVDNIQNSIDQEREKLLNEIKEKERQLKEIIENERIEKERKMKEKFDNEERIKKLKQEEERIIIEKKKEEERQRLEKLKQEEERMMIEKKKEEERQRLEKLKQEEERMMIEKKKEEERQRLEKLKQEEERMMIEKKEEERPKIYSKDNFKCIKQIKKDENSENYIKESQKSDIENNEITNKNLNGKNQPEIKSEDILNKRKSLNEQEKKVHNNLIKLEISTDEVFKQSIRNSIVNIINSNIEKLKEELIDNTLSAALKIVNNSSSKFINKSSVQTVHKKFSCNGCKIGPIKGIRYNCSVCEDFDFCEKCEEENGERHGHPFIKYRTENSSKTKCNLSNQNNSNSDQIDYNSMILQIKSQYDLQGLDDSKILNALISTKGNFEEAVMKLIYT